MRGPIRSRRALSSLFLFVLSAVVTVTGAAAATGAGLSAAEAFRLGEAMYLRGILPSGKPMTATVQGDLEVNGAMVTCAHCHMRGGLGSVEGGVLTLPTNGAVLYKPLERNLDLPNIGMGRGELKYPRPAYTDQALAKALRSGVDPNGRVMDAVMPRYVLDDREMEIMIFYLKNLSSQRSPGATDDAVRFATIVTDEVSPEKRSAMLEPLAAYLRDEWNANLSVLAMSARDKSYRPASLEVWELKGAPSTWREQLEKRYREQPVFAVIGGLSTGPWQPMHEFCEDNRIPCILPVTDLPAAPQAGWYTLYFSKGYFQEGEAAAKFLDHVRDLPGTTEVVQVFRDTGEGRALSRGFAETWRKAGRSAPKERVLSRDEKINGDFWKKLAAMHRKAVLLLWLGPEDLHGIEALADASGGPSAVFASSTMLDAALTAVPNALREFTYFTYPNRLPEETGGVIFSVEQWLAAKRIPVTDAVTSSKVYLLTRALSKVLVAMRGNFYRDYFLDLFDMLPDQTTTVAAYPWLSFGPGQRYAAKGCYIVSISKGETPKIIKQSDWLIY